MSSRARLTPEQPGEVAPPPVNVRLWYAEDNVEVPVDCTLAGWDHDEGAWLWVANNPRLLLPERILIDRLPAHTSITVGGRIDGE